MDSLRTPATPAPASAQVDDLSSLAWVHEELRRSLEAAHKALRRFVKESDALSGSDVDVVDPAVLRTARQQIHQGVGALELVGLPEAALLLRGSEAAVQRFVAKPEKLTSAEVETIERASFALLDYVQRMLSGRAVPALALFPQYQALQTLAGAERVHPADLWPTDWRWIELPPQDGVDARLLPDTDAVTVFEQALLAMMRGPAHGSAARMSDLCASLGAGASSLPSATMWRLAAAFFESLAQGLLKPDVYTRRVASRLLAQLRGFERGESEVSDRLAQDLLFFCAQSAAPTADKPAPRLNAVRHVYGLKEAPLDYNATHLGKHDPAWVAQARKRVAAARDAWSAVAGGEMHRLSGLPEQFALVGDSIKRLYPSGEHLADELQYAAVGTQQSNAMPPPALAMEVATSVLYLEASLEDADFDHADQGSRVRRLAERIGLVRQGRTPPALESWMEELYRRVSDRQTMGSVVQELHASLSEAEKSIDQFFRNPADTSVLMQVPAQLSAMRGVLSVLGLDHATQAVLRMRDDIDGLIAAQGDATSEEHPEIFDRLAGNVGALGFLINMLSVQPQAKSLFVFDAMTGRLNPLMGRAAPEVAEPPTSHLVEHAQSLAMVAGSDGVPVAEVTRELERLSQDASLAQQPALQAAVEQAQAKIEQALEDGDDDEIVTVRGELTDALVDFVSTANKPIGLDPQPLPVQPLSNAPASMDTDLGDDAEMREIFLEEAREVVETGEAATAALVRSPNDIEQLTSLRRAFHTLKGSSRMVGLKEFGEAGWVAEQVFNGWLAGQKAAEEPLLDFSRQTLAYMKDWVEAIAASQAAAYRHTPVKVAADALGAGRDWPVIALDAAPVEAPLPAVEAPPAEAPAAAHEQTLVLPQLPDLGVSAPVAEEPLPLHEKTLVLPQLPELEEPSAPVDAPVVDIADKIDFTLDLGALDEPAAVAPVAEEPAEATASATDELSFDLGGFDAPRSDEAPASADATEPASAEVLPFRRPDELPPGTGGDLLSFDLDAPAEPDVAEATSAIEAVETRDIAIDEEPANESSVFGELPTADVVEAAPEIDELAAEPAPVDEASVPEAHAESELEAEAEDDQVKVVGSLRISIPLFNIYLNEADELSRRLTTELAEWAMELHRPVGETAIAMAHSLAGSSATVGFADLSQLARGVEHALMRQQALGNGLLEDGILFVEAAEEIRRLLHQFAAGFLKSPAPDLLARLAEHELDSARRLEEQSHDEPSTDEVEVLPASAEAVVEEATDEAVEETVSAEPVDLPEPAAAPEVALVREPEPEAEPEPAAEPELQPEPEPVAEADPDFDPEPSLSRPAALDSNFGGLDGLGQAELKTFTPISVEEVRQIQIHTPREDVVADGEDDIDAVDAVDAELFPIFEEEAEELLPQLGNQLRDWARRPGDAALPSACMRTLHTLKGGARLAGAMRLGEMAHRLESAIEHLVAKDAVDADEVEALEARADALTSTFEALKSRDAQAYADAEAAVAQEIAQEPVEPPTLAPLEPLPTASTIAAPIARPEPEPEPIAATPAPAIDLDAAPVSAHAIEAPDEPAPFDEPVAPPAAAPAAPVVVSPRRAAAEQPVQAIDWSRFAASGPRGAAERSNAPSQSQASVRVRGPLLERMVNQAGEVSITRSRIEAEIGNIRSSLNDLTDNLDRLRGQLRDIEFQAELQMSSRLEAAKAADQAFDPLESDRFTRFQELTRMMAESVNDVATVHRTLQRTLQTTEDELVAQGRLTRRLQDDLLRTRMVEFESTSDRLYRVVRQAAKEMGKQVRLDLVGGSIEIDRGVLDRMTPAFEHLLRNCVTHGIEKPEVRTAAGKDATGTIIVSVSHEGNEVGVDVRDDGAGLDLERIRTKARAMGLLQDGDPSTEAELANLIFMPGFSTAETVTELAGRGVGMDVVRSEVNAMGGRIETATAAGQGTSFKLVLPLTTAVTQVVMLRCGDTVVAVPSTLIEIVRRASAQELEQAYETGSYTLGDRAMLFFWFGALLQLPPSTHEAGRMRSIVVVRSAQQRIALHVDEVLGNQEVVVKNLGPQLSRLPGLAGMTLLASGSVALIYNPVALATLYGESARAAMVTARQSTDALGQAAPVQAVVAAEPAVKLAPLVLVVDDSLTVRRVTQRLLVREGYRVELAKDGMEALERLAEIRPEVVLSDIEMPRMDGFDLVRNIRADAKLRDLPVIMITSRIAQKHRDYAAELGVDHYLGKPYSEDDLLALIARYTAIEAAT